MAISRLALCALGLLSAVACRQTSSPSGPSSPPAPMTAPSTAASPGTANRSPTASIKDYQPRTTAIAGGTHVSFGAVGTDPDADSLTFTWDFGDGTTDSGDALFHVFYKEGEFTVTLTVRDGRGGVATDSVRVAARRIAGDWQLVNAAHIPMTARISQGNGTSTFYGSASDGSLFTGQLLDPYGIQMDYVSSGPCIPSGSYQGGVSSRGNEILFPGEACRDIRLVR